ncbi:type I-E CRISPR-associated protein Cas7/Cse4/CasC [Rhodomicrobium sp.]|uniref:type I-E CRISPR-associated protein Cas7/Cse4/CasC n=1 Tax=Rhodomicrobium sp. TaxID=2720632 RepID=UPI0039E4996E
MTKFIQLHALTVYAPSNLNRDDTGRPKTAKFGGAERLRISSQALKRAIRTSANFRERLAGNLGERTQRLGEVISAHLRKSGVDDAKALEITRIVAGIFGKIEDAKDKPQTNIKQLAFISPEEKVAAFELADRLVKDGIDAFKDKKQAELAAGLLRRADTAADIAMFGRMLADNPDYNREAAVQVAHAITTHKVVVEDDFYTAVDDLKTSAEDAGAGFIGELGFGSGVFYLYASIDRDLLLKNLGGDPALARKAIEAFVEGFAKARPSGKQNSFAAHALANYLRVEKGSQQPRSLAAAFFKPVWGDDLLAKSVEALEGDDRKGGLIAQMNGVYGALFDDARTLRAIPGRPWDPGHDSTLEQIVAFAASE